ncbi:hypothetical protein [Anaerobacillus alkalidiazotrophicus]|uniref:hypothetical protein n=1 Tax=Anaerobacillus alkalidiazotrophicus TaxID=472963 RepID=UPI001470D239|nr:hypothetical protein [Anaerobacillus alkalidiazotrophicus]
MNREKLESRTLAYVIGYVTSISESKDRHEKEIDLANELLDEIFTELNLIEKVG